MEETVPGARMAAATSALCRGSGVDNPMCRLCAQPSPHPATLNSCSLEQESDPKFVTPQEAAGLCHVWLFRAVEKERIFLAALYSNPEPAVAQRRQFPTEAKEEGERKDCASLEGFYHNKKQAIILLCRTESDNTRELERDFLQGRACSDRAGRNGFELL